MPATLIAILNWNNAADTIACIESVIQMDEVQLAVMDNNSTDGSPAKIKAWLSKNYGYAEQAAGQLASFHPEHKVTFVQSKINGGFAQANNVLLSAAMNSPQLEYAWLLNNDAAAEPAALKAMIGKMEEDRQTAFVGSVILDGTNRSLIQCCGVKYYKWFGVSKLIMKNEPWTEESKGHIPHDKIDFQNGASLLVRLPALQHIGLMDERFFLYSEEHDWQHTAKEKGYKNLLAADSIVYHKGSVSTNTRRHLFFYYYNKSAIIFSRKHNPLLVRLVATLLQTGVMLVRTRLYPKSVYWGFKGIFEGWSISLK
jgi:GT2 family glycosyltransferase